MDGIQEWLQGKKTYILLVSAFVFNMGIALGAWQLDSQVWELINMVLVFLGVGAFRSAVGKAETK